jgi:predicted aspartyl protease
MSEGDGAIHTVVHVENLATRSVACVAEVVVDPNNPCTWLDERSLRGAGIRVEGRRTFEKPDGVWIERDVGYAIIHTAGATSVDEVVFAREGDSIVLGARTLSGLNLRVDRRTGCLVPGGPIVAAAAA